MIFHSMGQSLGRAHSGPPTQRVTVIGAGSAGLAVSHELEAAGVDHVVIEQSRVAQSWRSRWDSFTLVTPNWTMSLPGKPYRGDDPQGHVARDEIVEYLQGYAAGLAAPIREGIRVDALNRGTTAPFELQTSDGVLASDVVVVCTGAYQRPHRPAVAGDLPASIMAIDATEYTNPQALPDGNVLVVGSGQTGCQLAEELFRSGRQVFLACGRAPWGPRRAGGLDLITWLARTSFFDAPLSALSSPAARLEANAQATGAGGGHDLHYRTLQQLGVQLVGHLTAITDGCFRFTDDVAQSVAYGDSRYRQMRRLLMDQLPARGYAAPILPDPPAFRNRPLLDVDVRGIGVVIFASGFRPDYRSWISLPAFDDIGFPVTSGGASTAVPRLYFCGAPFLRKRKSSLLFGVGEDAAVIARMIAARGRVIDTNGHAGLGPPAVDDVSDGRMEGATQ
jgi:putative flavoprotein involved in K+ transport